MTTLAPGCFWCHGPLDPEDVDDARSAHEECEDMRWCQACREHHDDPQDAEDHNGTYTDWASVCFEDGVHRGITVKLTPQIHAVVHDGSRPDGERAAALASYLHANPVDDGLSFGRAGGYGLHWTDHLPTAQAWGSGEGALFGGELDRTDPEYTHVVMHAAAPGDGDFETDPEELAARNMLGYDHDRSEREIPLKASAPVHLTGLSWKPAGTPDDAWRRRELPAGHHAAAASPAEHLEDGTPLDDGHQDAGDVPPAEGEGLENPLGGDTWYHGSRAHPGDLAGGFHDPMFTSMYSFEDPDGQPDGHWNAALGTHCAASHDLAEEFGNGDHESADNEDHAAGGDPAFAGVAHVRLHLARPKVYRSEHDVDREVYDFEHAAGNHPRRHLEDGEEPLPDDLHDEEWENLEYSWPDTVRLIRHYGTGRIPDDDYDGAFGGAQPVRTTWLNSHPDRWDIGRRFRHRLIAAGYDGIAYRNEYERRPGDGLAAMCVVAFDPAAIEILTYHDTAAGCDENTLPRPAGPAPAEPAPPAGEAYTHGQWQQATEALQASLAGLPDALEQMLASLTSVDAGRTQVGGVLTLTDQAEAWAAQVKEMLGDVNQRELPVADTVDGAGGAADINAIPYMASA